ncbi:hypothetical protein FB451DRAFT_1272749 [Mycena latifolia]|nr:hypothetical protein FB451DRAFT_1272749 [Mycena latifolia]
MWTDVFRHITKPNLLYDVWKPAKTLNNTTLNEVWNCWSIGEVVFGKKPGQKPPIRLVEQHFKAKISLPCWFIACSLYFRIPTPEKLRRSQKGPRYQP